MISEKYNKVHLWIGINFRDESEYLKYFELDYSAEGDFDDPTYKLCDFCKDIGLNWYDEDFIGIIPRYENEVELDAILEEAGIDESEKERVKSECLKNGFYKANAIFWYADAELKLPTPIKNSYNGLKYIGLFEGD